MKHIKKVEKALSEMRLNKIAYVVNTEDSLKFFFSGKAVLKKLSIFDLSNKRILDRNFVNTPPPPPAPWFQFSKELSEKENSINYIELKSNHILLNNKIMHVDSVKTKLKETLILKKNKQDKTVNWFYVDDGLGYQSFLTFYTELKSVYYSLWNAQALLLFDKKYIDLNNDQKRTIRKDFPFRFYEMTENNYKQLLYFRKYDEINYKYIDEIEKEF